MTLERGVAGGVREPCLRGKEGRFQDLYSRAERYAVGTTVLTLASSRLLKASVQWV